MASNQDYGQLHTTDEHAYADPEKPNWAQTTTEYPRWWKHSRLSSMLVFISGLLLGIALTCALKPVAGSILIAFERTYAQTQPNKSIQVTDGLNVSFGAGVEIDERGRRCGKTRHEAEAAGCHYDLMASHWYPDECFDRELLDQVLTEVDFDWFWDLHHTRPATIEDALSGRWDQLYPLHDYHIMHCLYQWRRLHLAMIKHRYIDDDMYSYEHTLHCTRLITNWPNEWKYGKNSTDSSQSCKSIKGEWILQ